MNIAKKVINLNIYLIKQQKDIYMNTLCESLKGQIFNYIDLNTGEIKPDKFLLLIDIKTNIILSFYSDDEMLNQEARKFAKIISISTSSLQNPICRNGTPILIANGGKSISLTININNIEATLEGRLENFNRIDNYAVIGFSCIDKELSYRF